MHDPRIPFRGQIAFFHRGLHKHRCFSHKRSKPRKHVHVAFNATQTLTLLVETTKNNIERCAHEPNCFLGTLYADLISNGVDVSAALNILLHHCKLRSMQVILVSGPTKRLMISRSLLSYIQLYRRLHRCCGPDLFGTH